MSTTAVTTPTVNKATPNTRFRMAFPLFVRPSHHRSTRVRMTGPEADHADPTHDGRTGTRVDDAAPLQNDAHSSGVLGHSAAALCSACAGKDPSSSDGRRALACA